MTINNRDRRNRARTEPLPESINPLDPECCAQQLSEVMGELKLNMKAADELAKRQQSRDALPTTPPRRRKSRRPFRPWWQDI
jgi:hypothetical protein